MSDRTKEKLYAIQADAISWVLQETTEYLHKILTDDGGWNIAEVIDIASFAKDSAESIRNVRVPDTKAVK